MASTIKVNNIQNQCGANIANKCGSTITLGASGDTITLACGASQTGFGRTGTVDWDTTAKTASFTAVSGNGYFVNTTSGAITVTLPAGSPGDIVGISDYASTFQTNSVTITPNGTDKINGVNDNASLSTQGIAVSLVYVDSTRGWKSVTGSDNDTTGASFITATGGTITTCGNCKIHTFTAPGTFTVSSLACSPENNALAYMVIAGGGAGGGSLNSTSGGAGGGGAGGFREGRNNPITPYTASPLASACSALTATITSFPITVGGGGSGSAAAAGNSGNSSTFSTITSTGGGGGGARQSSPPTVGNGLDGGSGGGGGFGASSSGSGGSGNTPPVSPPQGNNGAAYGGSSNPGGGGGATVAGSTGSPCGNGGNGGAGATSSINGTPTARAGGGGGGAITPGVGGPGGGAAGSTGPSANAGTANTGGGGGGSSGCSCVNTIGGNGGSGVVIIRYKFQN